MASQELGSSLLPSNYDVAIELDNLAQEKEGEKRTIRNVQLRKEALEVMQKLSNFSPRLVGSVWRGTAHFGSDIDILVFHSRPEEVEKILERSYKILTAKWVSKTDFGNTVNYYHIHFESNMGVETEVVIRSPEEIYLKEKCEIYGDLKRGLSTRELEDLLNKDPHKKFVPKKRIDTRRF
jgi:predicted nucleotidyltransferase